MGPKARAERVSRSLVSERRGPAQSRRMEAHRKRTRLHQQRISPPPHPLRTNPRLHPLRTSLRLHLLRISPRLHLRRISPPPRRPISLEPLRPINRGPRPSSRQRSQPLRNRPTSRQPNARRPRKALPKPPSRKRRRQRTGTAHTILQIDRASNSRATPTTGLTLANRWMKPPREPRPLSRK